MEILAQLGLTPNEIKIYETLLEYKECSIWDISTRAGIHRRNVYDAIQRLIDKGLAFQILPKTKLTYAPVHPSKLREILNEKVADLEDLLPKLIRDFDRKNNSLAIYVFKGVGGLKNYINLILKTKKDLHTIGGKGTWFDPRIASFAKRADKKYKDLKIKAKVVYDYEFKEQVDALKIIGGDYKFLPAKYSSNFQVDIFGDYVAIYSGVNIRSLQRDITIFILKDKTLSEDYIKWFNFMWDFLPDHKKSRS
jgi:sugar-specific transcriptional regulator TrmB